MSVPDTLTDEERVWPELILPGIASIDASEVAGSPYCENGIHPGLYHQARQRVRKGSGRPKIKVMVY
jgi:hypothetical protein